ncbi:MAG: OmpA family protein [Nitrospira sp.]|nr:OmpA family protein [Nitrospira sp.]HNP27526.1 flagellar motor protein MotB [Nitrospirales bacterium]
MKKKHEEHENHERWLVSYADFITLLFAFFVVMYSVSSVNEGKFKVLSESLVSSFNNKKAAGEISIVNLPINTKTTIQVKENTASAENAQAFLKMANAITAANLPQGVKITTTERGLNIRIKDDALFQSGSAKLNPQIQEFIDLIGSLVKDLPNFIAVEGHTDNQPIRSSLYPSNWDLSTARANTLVRYLIDHHHLADYRLSSTGYAGTRPVELNDTPEGQASNRRVELIVLKDSRSDSTSSHPYLP